METTITVQGFHCKSCKFLVEDLCEEFESIESCNVDISTGKVVLKHTKDFDLEQFITELEALGEYTVQR